MILKNQTQTEVKIGYLGTEYSIPAGGELEVTDELGSHWMKVHGFLTPVSKTTFDLGTQNKKEEEPVKVIESTGKVRKPRTTNK